VIEELVAYNAKNPKILVNLAQRVGYIYHRFVEETVPVQWVHPGSWRKNLGLIQSKAGSRELQIAVKEQFKVTLNLDEIDAVGIWLYGAKMTLEDIVHWKIEKLVLEIILSYESGNAPVKPMIDCLGSATEITR